MKKIILIILISGVVSCVKEKEISEVVEVSCGQCNFDMKTPKSCDLAVRIDGIAYYVDGFSIDDFGDAHDEKTGFCEVIRNGNVTGKIINNRFEMASLIFMVPDSVVTH